MNRKLQFAVTFVSILVVAVLLLGAANNKSSSPEETYRHLGVFTEVLSKIKSEYVEEPDMKNVTMGAVSGLLESIDPYASYLSADQFKQYEKMKSEHKAEVGLLLAKRYGYISIVDAVPGSPADKAGLSTGDMIETISGISTRDMPLAYADVMLHGDAGTSVELSVLRFRKPEPQKLALVRSVIVYPEVNSKLMADAIGYVQVQSLLGNRVSEVASAVSFLEKKGAKRFVLDLRNCASGEMEQGAALANVFLDNGMLTYTQGQKSPRSNKTADPAKSGTRLPVTVITNRGTAGAAEIAAAALLETKKSPIVGERTYGDAAVRRALTMDDGAAVILSVAKYYSPDGKAIQDVGVTPSVPVVESSAATEPTDDEDDSAKPEAPKKAPAASSEDLLLKKALEVASGKSAETQADAAKKLNELNPSLGQNPLQPK